MTKLAWIAIGCVVATGTIIGGGFYYIQGKKSVATEQRLMTQVSNLQSQITVLEKEIEEKEKSTPPTSTPAYLNNPATATCDFWKNIPYGKVYSGFGSTGSNFESISGTLILPGKIVSREKSAAYEPNKKVTAVYLAISKPEDGTPQATFYNEYVTLVKGKNSINALDGDTLLFRLGIKEGSTFVSDTRIDDKLRQTLLGISDKNISMNIQLTVEPPIGRGVGDSFSFACAMQAE